MCKALVRIKVAACQVLTTEDIEFSKNRVISFLEIAAAQQVGPRFGIATECGMGRRPPETIPALLRLHAALAG